MSGWTWEELTGQGNTAPAIPANGQIPQFAPNGQPLAPMVVDPPRPAALPPAAGWTFEELAHGASEAPKSTGLIANIGAGANEAIAGTVGGPTDLMGKALKWLERAPYALAGGDPNSPEYWKQVQPGQDPEAMARGHQAFEQAMDNPIGGSGTVDSALGLIGADPRNVAPADETEQIARAAGRGAGSMVLPYGVARGAIAAGIQPSSTVGQAVLDATGNGSLTGNAVTGAVAGGTGQFAANRAPPELAPLADFAGQMLGGGLAAGSVAATKALLDSGGSLARGFVAPFNVGAKDAVATSSRTGEPIMATAGQQRLAGQQILDRASGAPGSFPGQLDEAMEGAPLVPGSQPTTFQLTGNPGIGQLERAKATTNADLFNQRSAEQNAARVSAIDSLSDNGNPAAVGRFVRQQLGALADRDEAAVAAAQQSAQDASTAIGGTGRPQDYGATLRGSLSDLRDAAKARTSALWQAIDPDGTLAIDITPTRQAAQNIGATIGSYAKPPEGEEAAILSLAQRMPDTVPFSDLTDLRSRLLSAIAAERSGPSPDMQAVRRMSMLSQAMDDTIATGAERQAQQEAQAVQGGSAAPQDTIVGRLDQAQRQVPSVVFPEAPAASVTGAGGVPVGVTFPDRDHAALYAYGQRVLNGQGSDVARNSLFQRFRPWVQDDFRSPKDVDSLATDYVDMVHDLAGNPKAAAPVELPSVVDSDLVADWHRQRYENARLAAGVPGAAQGDMASQGMASGRMVGGISPASRGPITSRGQIPAAVAGRATPYETVPTAPPRLVDWLRSLGGVKDAGGDIRHTLGGARFRPGLINNKDGVALDDAAVAAHEAGFLPEAGDQPTINHLLDAIADDVRGNPRYSERDSAAAEAYETAMAHNAEVDRLANELGIDPRGKTREQFFDEAAGKVPEADVEAAGAAHAQAHDEKLAGAERAAQGAPGGPEDAVMSGYLPGRPRTLEDLENEYRQEEAARGLGQGSGADGAVGSAGARAGSGQAGQGSRGGGAGTGQRAQAPSLQRDPSQAPLTPNFDAEAAARYRAAADAHREERQTFGAGPVGAALQPGPNRTPFRVPDSQVAAQFFNAGPHSAEDVQAFLRAAGSRQDAVAALQDYAASDLRRAASNPDGTLNAGKLQRWVAQHQDALAPFPDLAARFNDAGAAQQAVDEATAARAAAAKVRQGYAAQQFVGADPVKAVGAALRDPGEMAKLVRWAALDPSGDATEGLRAAAVDLMKQRFLSNAAAGDTGTTFLKADGLQTFIRNNGASLAPLFPGERMQTLENVAADLQRAAQSNATKLPSSPGTAQDLIANAKHAAESGHGGGNLLSYLIALGVEHGTGSLTGAIGGAMGVKAATAMRSRGIATVDDLVTEAMLDPQLARLLVAKVPSGTGSQQLIDQLLDRTAAHLRTLGPAAAVSSQAPEPAHQAAAAPMMPSQPPRVSAMPGPPPAMGTLLRQLGVTSPRQPPTLADALLMRSATPPVKNMPIAGAPSPLARAMMSKRNDGRASTSGDFLGEPQ